MLHEPFKKTPMGGKTSAQTSQREQKTILEVKEVEEKSCRWTRPAWKVEAGRGGKVICRQDLNH